MSAFIAMVKTEILAAECRLRPQDIQFYHSKDNVQRWNGLSGHVRIYMMSDMLISRAPFAVALIAVHVKT